MKSPSNSVSSMSPDGIIASYPVNNIAPYYILTCLFCFPVLLLSALL
jgi:hypothetical protein